MNISDEIKAAEVKAIDSLARYKFVMFGYWAGIWVHLNKIEGKKRPNPFRPLVASARCTQRQREEARAHARERIKTPSGELE